MKYWRKKISDIIFYFLSIFGFIVYLPSVVMAVREGLYAVVAVDTVIYLFCLLITFYKKLGYYPRAVIGSVMFYILGLILLLFLGPAGAGEIWLFACAIVTAFLLGNTGAVIVFIVNTLTMFTVYVLIRLDVISWSGGACITAGVWLVKTVNFMFLNLVIIILNVIFVKGFSSVLARAVETRNASIIGLARLAEHRDTDTGEHLRRIQSLSAKIAVKLTENKKYREYITEEYIADIKLSSILHDIGKVGIPDVILLKPGPLTAEEFDEIKRHPVVGSNVISEIEKNIKGRSFYVLGREIALYHHEKWDGSGYPEGLKGTEIPLSARIVALADVYDALTSKRPYKDPIPHKKTLEIIKEGRGSHFDPDIVDAFLAVEKEISSGLS